MMPKTRYDERQLKDLLLQMMETELGGEKVYRTALQCASNEDLKEEWEKYLEETLSHQNVVRTTCEFLGINADEVTPSRQVVKHIGLSLVKAMELALSAGDRSAAQLVACECVVHAETKDFQPGSMRNCSPRRSVSPATPLVVERSRTLPC